MSSFYKMAYFAQSYRTLGSVSQVVLQITLEIDDAEDFTVQMTFLMQNQA